MYFKLKNIKPLIKVVEGVSPGEPKDLQIGKPIYKHIHIAKHRSLHQHQGTKP